MERKRRMTMRNVALGILLAAVALAAVLTFADPGYRPAARFRGDSPLARRLDGWLHGRPGMLHSDAPATVSDILHRSRPTPVAGSRPTDNEPPPPPRP